jgi:hypothetical protein
MDETEITEERWFARMGVLADGSWTVNFIVFKDGTVTQHGAGPGGNRDMQEAQCSFLDFDPRHRVLRFRPGSMESEERLEMGEIRPEVGHKILEDHNWANLLKGLANKSQRTLQWLEARNIKR